MFRAAKRQPLVATALCKSASKWKWARKWLDRNRTLPQLYTNGRDVSPTEMRRCHPSLSPSFGGDHTYVPKLIVQAKAIVKGKDAIGSSTGSGWANAYDSEDDPMLIVGAWIAVKPPNGRYSHVCKVVEYIPKHRYHMCRYWPSEEKRAHVIGGINCEDWHEVPMPKGAKEREKGGSASASSPGSGGVFGRIGAWMTGFGL